MNTLEICLLAGVLLVAAAQALTNPRVRQRALRSGGGGR